MSRQSEPRARYGPRTAVLVGVAVLVVLAGTVGDIWGAFFDGTQNSGNEIVAVTDFVAPTADRSVIQKSAGGSAGYIRQGGTYRAYANVTDSGNPESGIGSVRANLSTITNGQSSAVLSAGSFTVDGQSYNYRSASLSANALLPAATYNYSLSMQDAAGNTRTAGGYTVIVDNTNPLGSAIQTANGSGGTVGKPELGDAITFTFSEQLDPSSVLSGWGGTSTNVVVRINNNVSAQGGLDALVVYNSANSSALPLGTVRLGRTDYVTANTTFGVTGARSTMVRSGNAIIVTLGGSAGSPSTAGGNSTMTWFPSAVATDNAGNTVGTASVTESGAADKEF